ncbi:biotin synthase BioB [Tepidibacillus fermentans]|uniref:Biotin synthase n=1 Tax=Tepidibacillus fermentans TaxID=1281767 RepID=A0A4V2UT54_9BACI|nr:biotin synthase BioB [Tepidibacillus fermentans]TCS84219.1 biotin synthase [Tepidibacillus fermentans]
MIQHLKEKVISGYEITKEEALSLAQIKKNELEELLDAANEIREAYLGKQVDLCTIINAKSGGCSEDCKFCAQSSHYHTDIPRYPLIHEQIALERAKEVELQGAHRFSLVTSGKGIGNRDFAKILEIYKILKENTSIHLCSSLGIISYEKAKALKEVGVTTYHHNLETSRQFYPSICATHHYDDRIKTIKNAQAAGLNICSGGIIGMGETMEDRIDMALDLRELKVQSVPINILTPIVGTPLEHVSPLPIEEILKTIAIFRFILPSSHIRLAGGRRQLGESQAKGFQSGVSAAIVGDYLTTVGSTIAEDIKMLEQMGFQVKEKLVV